MPLQTVTIILCNMLLAFWWFSYPGLPLHHWLVLQAQILKESAGSLHGSCSSVVRALTAKVRGLVLDPQWLRMPSVCFYPDLPPVAYHQFLPPVVTSYKD